MCGACPFDKMGIRQSRSLTATVKNRICPSSAMGHIKHHHYAMDSLRGSRLTGTTVLGTYVDAKTGWATTTLLLLFITIILWGKTHLLVPLSLKLQCWQHTQLLWTVTSIKYKSYHASSHFKEEANCKAVLYPIKLHYHGFKKMMISHTS